MVIPPNAAYVSRDGLVTFDENGRKLDSLGNVAWADTQTLKGADARPLERPAAPPPPPQAQRAAAAVAPPLTPQRFFPEVAPPSTALGMPQSGPVRPGMTDYRPQPKPNSNPYGTPPGYGPAQPGQGGSQPTIPFAANPNPGQTMGGGYTPDILRPGGYVGPSTTDTSSWQAPQPGVDPWAVAPGAPYTPPNAGGYPDNVKTEAQRSAPRFDDGTQQMTGWGFTGGQQPPQPPGGREYWERGGERSAIERMREQMRFKSDEMRMDRPRFPAPSQGYAPPPSGIIQGPMENPGLYDDPQQQLDPWSVAPGAPYIPPANTYETEWRQKAFGMRHAMPGLYGDGTGEGSQLPGDRYNPNYRPPFRWPERGVYPPIDPRDVVY